MQREMQTDVSEPVLNKKKTRNSVQKAVVHRERGCSDCLPNNPEAPIDSQIPVRKRPIQGVLLPKAAVQK